MLQTYCNLKKVKGYLVPPGENIYEIGLFKPIIVVNVFQIFKN